MFNNLKYLAIFSLFLQLNALPFHEDFQIGLGFDQNSSTIKPSPFNDYEIKTNVYKQNIEKKIVKIDNFEHLLDEIGMEKTFSIFKSKTVKQLLSNSQINDYTHTYLIYKRVANFKNSLQLEKSEIAKEYKDCYIDSIEIGDEFIALVHIKTNSLNEYEKIEKILDKKILKFERADELEKKFEEISKTHVISFKNTPTTNIKELITAANTINRDIPYKVNIKNYKNNPLIKEYLKALQTLNNLEYIRRNSEQFVNHKTLKNQKRELSKYLLMIEKGSKDVSKNLQKLLKSIEYPQQHKAYIGNKNLRIPKLQLPSITITKKYPKISDKTIFTLHYDFKLMIKNSGKVIILDWTKTLKDGKNLIQKDTNSKILLDSYINYKNLKATNIVGNNYGSLTFTTTFDSYEKNIQIKGQGIIDSADCNYKVIDENGTFEIKCDNIKLKELNIKFEHEE